jgi:hypothetical protein
VDTCQRICGGKPAVASISHNTEEDCALLFVHACRMGLEGIVSKLLSAPYRSPLPHARLPRRATRRRASHELVHALSISLGPFENALALLTTRVWIVIWIGAQDLQVG